MATPLRFDPTRHAIAGHAFKLCDGNHFEIVAPPLVLHLHLKIGSLELAVALGRLALWRPTPQDFLWFQNAYFEDKSALGPSAAHAMGKRVYGSEAEAFEALKQEAEVYLHGFFKGYSSWIAWSMARSLGTM